MTVLILKRDRESEHESGAVGGDRAPMRTSLRPHRTGSPEGFLQMIRRVAREANENRGYALWHTLRYVVVGFTFWLGGTFLFAGHHAAIEPSFRLLENLEPGGIRTHGFILCVLAFLLFAAHRYVNYVLYLSLFYLALTAALLVGGWTVRTPDLSTPAWYVLLATISFILAISSPGPRTWSPLEGGGGQRA